MHGKRAVAGVGLRLAVVAAVAASFIACDEEKSASKGACEGIWAVTPEWKSTDCFAGGMAPASIGTIVAARPDGNYTLIGTGGALVTGTAKESGGTCEIDFTVAAGGPLGAEAITGKWKADGSKISGAGAVGAAAGGIGCADEYSIKTGMKAAGGCLNPEGQWTATEVQWQSTDCFGGPGKAPKKFDFKVAQNADGSFTMTNTGGAEVAGVVATDGVNCGIAGVGGLIGDAAALATTFDFTANAKGELTGSGSVAATNGLIECEDKFTIKKGTKK